MGDVVQFRQGPAIKANKWRHVCEKKVTSAGKPFYGNPMLDITEKCPDCGKAPPVWIEPDE